MKLHILLIKAVAEALTDIFQNGKYADKVIERLLKSNPKWGSRDRNFIAETTYECVRWVRLYNALRGNNSSVNEYTEGGDFQIDKLSNDDFIELIGIHWVLKIQSNLDFDRFKHLNYETLKASLDGITDRKIRYSIPDWLDDTGVKELGVDKWTSELEALNKQAQVVLRCNTLKTSIPVLKQKLTESGIEAEKIIVLGADNRGIEALILNKRANLATNDLYKKGQFEVQDAGSQLIAPFLEVNPNMLVIDACAGAGGKTLHLATLMNNQGRLIAMDTEGYKLTELRSRAQRNGINIIETQTINSPHVIERLSDIADRLLLDVPCSGLGVLRRNPDTKWKLKPEFLDSIRQTQADIIEQYAKMVKSGGKMVYATCSILPSENNEQVATFLQNNKNWRLLNEHTLYAHIGGFDGFYMALLERIY